MVPGEVRILCALGTMDTAVEVQPATLCVMLNHLQRCGMLALILILVRQIRPVAGGKGTPSDLSVGVTLQPPIEFGHGIRIG